MLYAALTPAFSGALLSARTVQAESPTGTTVTVDSSGAYRVASSRLNWEFSGTVPSSISGLSSSLGTDLMGPYHEVAFDATDNGTRHLSIRNYQGRSAVVFTAMFGDAAPNAYSFPTFTAYPAAHSFTWSGLFAAPYFGGHTADSPWLFFDADGRAAVLSPASNFMVADTSFGSAHESYRPDLRTRHFWPSKRALTVRSRPGARHSRICKAKRARP